MSNLAPLAGEWEAVVFMARHGATHAEERTLLSMKPPGPVIMFRNEHGEFFTFWNVSMSHNEEMFLGAWLDNLMVCFVKLFGKENLRTYQNDLVLTIVDRLGQLLEANGYRRDATVDTILLMDTWSTYHMPNRGRHLNEKQITALLFGFAALAMLDIDYAHKIDAAERQIPAEIFTTYEKPVPYPLIQEMYPAP